MGADQVVEEIDDLLEAYLFFSGRLDDLAEVLSRHLY